MDTTKQRKRNLSICLTKEENLVKNTLGTYKIM